MTTNEPAKPSAAPSKAAGPLIDTVSHSAAKADAAKLMTVTLDQLAGEMNVSPRDARMLLRLAAKQTKLYPTLGKEHTPRQPWQWTAGSKALDEARKALTAEA